MLRHLFDLLLFLMASNLEKPVGKSKNISLSRRGGETSEIVSNSISHFTDSEMSNHYRELP